MAQPICVSQRVRHFIYSVSFTVFQSIGSVGKNNKATLGSEKLGVVFLNLFLLAGGSEKRGFVRNSRSFLAPLGGKPRTGFLLLLGSPRLLWPLYENCFFSLSQLHSASSFLRGSRPALIPSHLCMALCNHHGLFVISR